MGTNERISIIKKGGKEMSGLVCPQCKSGRWRVSSRCFDGSPKLHTCLDCGNFFIDEEAK